MFLVILWLLNYNKYIINLGDQWIPINIWGIRSKCVCKCNNHIINAEPPWDSPKMKTDFYIRNFREYKIGIYQEAYEHSEWRLSCQIS